MIVNTILVLASSFIAAWSVTKASIPLLRKIGCLDIPNNRSSHVVPIPRGGGIGIIAGLATGIFLACLIGSQLPGGFILFGALMVALVGAADDLLGGISVLLRLIVQCIAAGIVVSHAGGLEHLPLPVPLDYPLGALAIPAAMLWIVGITNIYNFLDGIDGFAALQGAIVGIAIALLGSGSANLAVGLAIAGTCFGFLLHNWHPAKMFMGDTSATTLGFIVAALPFQLDHGLRAPTVFAIAICIWFFIADGTLTIFLRLSRGEKLWQPHRSHLYQRLVQSGLRHDQVVVVVLTTAAVLSILATLAHRTNNSHARWGVLALALAAFWAYWFWATVRERRIINGLSKSGTRGSRHGAELIPARSKKHRPGSVRPTVR